MTGFGHLAVSGGTTGYIVAAGREPRGSASLAELACSMGPGLTRCYRT
jgi:hypothetical protein